jgi:hypothetical protein
MSLTTPFSVQKLQTALHAKAKESPDFRFHALYDKVYRKDVLAYAYERCQANGGAAGVDNQTFEDIEAYNKERWLDELTQRLNLSTAACAAGLYTQAGWEAETVRDTDNPGSGCANGGRAGTRTYLRGRPAAGAVWLSGGPQRTGRSTTRPLADQYWTWADRGCGSQQLL